MNFNESLQWLFIGILTIWMCFKHMPSLPAIVPALEPEEGYKELSDGESSGIMLLEDCSTLLVSPREGCSVRLPVKAVTMVEFVRVGWMVNFANRKLEGKLLADGLYTKVSRKDWTDWTDALAEARLIRKESRGACVNLCTLAQIQAHVTPLPMLAGWRGWHK